MAPKTVCAKVKDTTPQIQAVKAKVAKKTISKRILITKSNQLVGIKCPICLSSMNKDDIMSTKCGHVFCTACLQIALSKKTQCPTCKTGLKGRSGYHMLFL